MQKNKIDNNFFYKEIVFFLILYLSLILGFFLSENSTGGAIVDYYNQKNISKHFANNFLETFLNYDNYSSRHSPVLIILLSFLEKINFPDVFTRLLHLHICLLLPYIFYKIIREKFDFLDKKRNPKLQPLVKGDNLVSCLESVYDLIETLSLQIEENAKEILKLNKNVAFHTHTLAAPLGGVAMPSARLISTCGTRGLAIVRSIGNHKITRTNKHFRELDLTFWIPKEKIHDGF